MGGIFLGHFLIRADERLDSFEMFTFVAIFIMVCGILEILAVWWESRTIRSAHTDSYYEMVGKRGTVAKECSPDGTVKIGQEIWNAVSNNKAILKPGDVVTVKDRQGLRLYVEKTS
jgi:membrane protein implicated in regulation of membrane protease activity